MRNVNPLGYHRQTKIEPYEKHRFKFCNNDEVSLLIEEIEHTSTEFKFETGLTIQDILIFISAVVAGIVPSRCVW